MKKTIIQLHSRQPIGSGSHRLLLRDCYQRSFLLTEGAGPVLRDLDMDFVPDIREARMCDWADIVEQCGNDVDVVTNDEYCLEIYREIQKRQRRQDRLPSDVTLYRDKWAMRTKLLADGVPVAPAVLWYRKDESLFHATLRGNLGCNVVIKPRCEANLRGIRHTQDVTECTQIAPAVEDAMLVERFLTGEQFHVELLIWDGDVRLLMVGEYLSPLLGLANGRPSGSITLTPEHERWNDLEALSLAAVNSLGTNGRFISHVEMLSQDGQLIVGEATCRAPGGDVPWQCSAYCGIDLEEANLCLQQGRDFAVTSGGNVAAWIWIPGEVGELSTVFPGGTTHRRFIGRAWLAQGQDYLNLRARTASAMNLAYELSK